MRRMGVCLYLCLCLLCIFIHSGAIKHPATYQSKALCVHLFASICSLHVYPSNWSMPQLVEGRAFGILKEMSSPSPVKEILCLEQKRQITGESRERLEGWFPNMQTFKSRVLICLICKACTNLHTEQHKIAKWQITCHYYEHTVL